MGRIYFDPPVSAEYRILNEYAKKTFCKTPQIVKIKESGWGRVFLVKCQKPSRWVVLKCSVTSADLEHEYKSLLFLKNNGIANVPKVIAFEKFENLYVLSLDFIKSSGNINTKGQKVLAGILAKIHSIKCPGADNACLEQAYKIFSEASCLASYLNQPKYLSLYKKCKRIIQMLERTIEDNKVYFMGKKDLVFINGDLADDSIRCYGNKMNIIDWHASGFADNAWDIARLLLNNPETINKRIFLKEYLTHIEDKYFTKRFETYWLLNKLFTLLFFFFQSEWHSFPMQYSSKRFLEENLDIILK